MNVLRITIQMLILLYIISWSVVSVQGDTWDEQQAERFFQDMDTQIQQSINANDRETLQSLWRKVVGAMSPEQLAENWHPMAHYYLGGIEVAIAMASNDQKEKSTYFSNAMQSFERSAAGIPDFCMNFYLQGVVLHKYYNEPTEALSKLNQAVTLCPDLPSVQQDRKEIIEVLNATPVATDKPTNQVSAAQADPNPLPTEGIPDFEPIPFE